MVSFLRQSRMGQSKFERTWSGCIQMKQSNAGTSTLYCSEKRIDATPFLVFMKSQGYWSGHQRHIKFLNIGHSLPIAAFSESLSRSTWSGRLRVEEKAAFERWHPCKTSPESCFHKRNRCSLAAKPSTSFSIYALTQGCWGEGYYLEKITGSWWRDNLVDTLEMK